MGIYYKIKLQRTIAMFFQHNKRIKTEPRIIDSFQNTFYENKRRMKIKNIRFSLGQQINQADLNELKNEFKQKKEDEHQRGKVVQQKRSIFLKKLPELNFQNKEIQKQVTKQSKQSTVKNKQKEIILNSILDILNPNSIWNTNSVKSNKITNRFFGDCKAQFQAKDYKNQFNEQITHHSSTKHHRTPKILQNDLMKFKNSSNIVRRKIYSEDKTRQRQSKQASESNKTSHDLQKILIVTFSNKFPLFKKQNTQIK